MMNRTNIRHTVRYGLMFLAIALAMVLLAVPLIMVTQGFSASTASAAASAAPVNPLAAEQASPSLLQSTNGALPRTITVIGEGSIQVEPDIATATIGVDIRKEEVKSANDEAATTMAQIIEALKARGIDEADIQTAGYNIWVEQGFGPDPFGGQSQPTMYHVNNSLVVTIRDLDAIGDVLNDAVEAGANNIHSVIFAVDNPDEAMSQLRADAVADANARAAELADLGQVSLGRIVSMSEVIGGGNSPFGPLPFANMMGGGAPIIPGQSTLALQLQVTYELE